ncbi:unnamed protein product [Amoebophrya sp. A120]|nr:unnamed protein product [Amoebophrya sp. A120]|eukprot:GSA120T00022275001.1
MKPTLRVKLRAAFAVVLHFTLLADHQVSACALNSQVWAYRQGTPGKIKANVEKLTPERLMSMNGGVTEELVVGSEPPGAWVSWPDDLLLCPRNNAYSYANLAHRKNCWRSQSQMFTLMNVAVPCGGVVVAAEEEELFGVPLEAWLAVLGGVVIVVVVVVCFIGKERTKLAFLDACICFFPREVREKRAQEKQRAREAMMDMKQLDAEERELDAAEREHVRKKQALEKHHAALDDTKQTHALGHTQASSKADQLKVNKAALDRAANADYVERLDNKLHTNYNEPIEPITAKVSPEIEMRGLFPARRSPFQPPPLYGHKVVDYEQERQELEQTSKIKLSASGPGGPGAPPKPPPPKKPVPWVEVAGVPTTPVPLRTAPVKLDENDGVEKPPSGGPSGKQAEGGNVKAGETTTSTTTTGGQRPASSKPGGGGGPVTEVELQHHKQQMFTNPMAKIAEV